MVDAAPKTLWLSTITDTYNIYSRCDEVQVQQLAVVLLWLNPDLHTLHFLTFWLHLKYNSNCELHFLFQSETNYTMVTNPCAPRGSLIPKPYSYIFEAPCTAGKHAKLSGTEVLPHKDIPKVGQLIMCT
jgi:hypothetical protein